jgi:hypothetical protein
MVDICMRSAAAAHRFIQQRTANARNVAAAATHIAAMASARASRMTLRRGA